MESIAAPSSASVQIDIQGWVESANKLPSKNEYVQNAVGLAWMLTQHLCQTITIDTAAEFQDHNHINITAENVVIFIERPTFLQFGVQAPSIQGVKFRFESHSVASLLPGFLSCTVLPVTAHAEENKAHFSPHGICAALGKILLKLFSRGRSSSLENSIDDLTENEYVDIEVWTQADGDENGLPPAGKRQATVAEATGKSMSAKANDLLLDLDMPLSIRQLVCDLLDADNESDPSILYNPNREVITSLEEVLEDLTHMKNNPQCFLFDRMCPQKALDDAELFGNADGHHLYGREKEMDALMTAKTIVSNHIYDENINQLSRSAFAQSHGFLCEAIFVGGYAGSGKSVLVHSLTRSCDDEQWFVLNCKFDKQVAPHMTMVRAFDDFFGKLTMANGDAHNNAQSDSDSSRSKSFHQVCKSIFSTTDTGSFRQLCGLVPNLAKIYPLPYTGSNNNQDQISSMDKIGSAKKRLQNLIHIILKSLCSTGRPVWMALDDLQWCDSSVMEVVTDFVVNHSHNTSEVSGVTCRQGLLITGTYRSNELKENDNISKQINVMKQSESANVTMLSVGELSKVDISMLISAKLCLPRRYVQELAQLVHSKTRGNVFFVVQFLRTLVQNKMLEFSVKSPRRWMWDHTTVEMQMISEGVAELLTSTFSQLPSKLMKTIKIVSFLGSQVEESTIDAMNSRQKILPFSMLNELEQSVHVGIMEKAGPVYQFTHDIVHQTVYDLTPPMNRKLLHKTIGMALLDAAPEDDTIILLAMDQINKYCVDGNLSREERAKFAASNAQAAKIATAASSFEQAKSYIDVGIQMLDTQHWESQYSLSLDLYEMSASVSCMHGDIDTMSTHLGEILSHAETFDDTLKASTLLVKLLTSCSKHDEARSNCLIILSKLGLAFPKHISLPVVLCELAGIQTTLSNITIDSMNQLPQMTDRSKRNAMHFLNMLCMCSIVSKPMMIPLVSSRMVRLMLDYGLCDDAIVGLATAAYSVFLFTEDFCTGHRIGKICETLVDQSPNRHLLRSRLCSELVATLKISMEPIQAVIPLFPELYNSAMMAGDIENAIMCRWTYIAVSYYSLGVKRASLAKHFIGCVKEAAKYQQETIKLSSMSYLNACSSMTGNSSYDIEVKSYVEIDAIADRTNNVFLSFQTFMCQLSDLFLFRNYMAMADLSEKHSEKHPTSQQKRVLGMLRSWYEGIATLSLARDTRQLKWRALGEKALADLSKWAMVNKWIWQHKYTLLQAEYHYLDGDLPLAEAAYKASIVHAHNHKFPHEKAMLHELYGIFCVENNMMDEGSKQLQFALDGYKQWGATMKVNDVQRFLDLLVI